MIEHIRGAKHKGDSLGGIFEVVVTNPPIGLGTYAQWDRRLTARLAMAAMSIQAMKGVEIGMGFESARRYGSEVHDDIYFDQTAGQFIRKSNNGGWAGRRNYEWAIHYCACGHETHCDLIHSQRQCGYCDQRAV